MQSKVFVAAAIVAAVVLVAPAHAGLITFEFEITVAQEVPTPTIPDEFDPSGTGVVTLDTDSNMIEWMISYQGLTGEIVSPGAHLHGPANVGETAGIEVFLSDGAPPLPATGTLTGATMLSDQQVMDLLAGLWYVNIHTELNPAGEIRGQVVPVPAGLALLGLAGLAARRRRRV